MCDSTDLTRDVRDLASQLKSLYMQHLPESITQATLLLDKYH